MMKKKFSIILPIYKNEQNIPITVPHIMNQLDLFPNYDVEVIMVCDGSPDNSYTIMKEYQNKYPETIKIVNLLKNYGQRSAVNCGMSIASGDVIGVISADMQDPFELFKDMLALWEDGNPLVIAKREGREETSIGAYCSMILHKFINKNINANYPNGGFDFFVVDRKITEKFVIADTFNNSMQLLLLELAGSAKQIGYIRAKREVGSSGWSLSKKLNQSLNIFAIYSDKPFRCFLFCGVLCMFFAVCTLIWMLFHWFVNGMLSLFSPLYALLFCLFGLMLILLSLLGLYGFKWMQNIKDIPRFIIDEKIENGKEVIK